MNPPRFGATRRKRKLRSGFVPVNRQEWARATRGLSVEARGLLMDLMVECDDRNGELSGVTMRFLANELNMAKTTLHRHLKELRGAGLVDLAGGRNQHDHTTIRLPRFDQVIGVDVGAAVTAEANLHGEWIAMGLKFGFLNDEKIDSLRRLSESKP